MKLSELHDIRTETGIVKQVSLRQKNRRIEDWRKLEEISG